MIIANPNVPAARQTSSSSIPPHPACLTDLPELESTLKSQLNRCENTNASDAVSALQSQASRLIQFGASLTAASGVAKTTGGPVTAIGVTDTPAERASLSSVFATATWAAGHSSGMASVSAANRTSTPIANPAALTSAPSSVETKPPGPGPALSHTWIAGPVLGSILGVSTVLIVIYCTRRKQRREEWELGAVQPKEFRDDDSTAADSGKPQLHSECVPPKELDNSEVVLPAELPALEPVGMELLTPRDVTDKPEKEWPLPISPLPALFAEAEMRDERAGKSESPKHETFYHP
ncbi:uncharacterized protein BP5553_02962 [Venustampulla echinocandica]|uniref:Transmembrane protein n=1 Tax=Venustampulla echinocandica TaxID=2656787 RepID=A0A370TSX0_9HELO|nr:uncharacterized protein BP5553_02962 [Venustampulla echinocandica]RDL38622.1 hypothetical protein BP5553_02962 [Venustampulla echinocandica]